MDKTLTLDDVLTQPVDVLLQKLRQPVVPVVQVAPEVTVEDALIEATVESVGEILCDMPPIEDGDPEEVDLSILKGFFPVGNTFAKGNTYNVGPYSINILGLIPSANRVKFQVVETGTVHSIPSFTLTGASNDFPYKKGDMVTYDGSQHEVKRINPANNNVVLFINDRYQYVKISKIYKV